jgi:SAM-dependent methyltransferase
MTNTKPVEEFAERLSISLRNGTFVRLVFSGPLLGDGAPEKVLGRLVTLKSGPHLSLTYRHATRDDTKNLSLADVENWAKENVGTQFRNALLSTTKRDWQLFAPEPGKAKLTAHKPSSTAAPSRSHDKPRQAILNESAHDWLFGLGVVNERGQVRPLMADKYAQINHYLDIFTHLSRVCGWMESPQNHLTIADMGCGKGYLTFGLWHLFARFWKRPIRVIGIEARPELVNAAKGLSRKVGATGLEFMAGSIESVGLPKIDALIALHACDTATDDAIRRGIECNAQLIIVAPCCHKEVRPQLGRPEPLAPVLEHGLMAERMAEWSTDGLRALFLEWAGYQTKIIEFVSTEHTPKNLMIAAVRRNEPFTSKIARGRIDQFKEFFEIKHHALDSLLKHGLGES